MNSRFLSVNFNRFEATLMHCLNMTKMSSVGQLPYIFQDVNVSVVAERYHCKLTDLITALCRCICNKMGM